MGREKYVFACLAVFTVGAIAYQSATGAEGVRAYDTGFAKVELIGVCKATETEASCWDGEGKSAPDLEQDFKGAISSEHRYLPLRFGFKTRVAVFRITNPPYNDPRGTIDTYFQSSSGGSFDWPNRGTSSAEEVRVEIRPAVIIAKLNDAEGSASTTIRRTAAASKRIPLKEGASVNYLGSTFTIRKIIKSTADPATFINLGGTRWVVAMTSNDKDGLPPTMSWVAIDNDGLVIRAVDKEGTPVIVSGVPSYMPNAGIPGRAGAPQILAASFTSNQMRTPGGGDDYTIFSNINPAKIKEIYAFGSSTERLTIKGIPLEPH